MRPLRLSVVLGIMTVQRAAIHETCVWNTVVGFANAFVHVLDVAEDIVNDVYGDTGTLNIVNLGKLDGCGRWLVISGPGQESPRRNLNEDVWPLSRGRV